MFALLVIIKTIFSCLTVIFHNLAANVLELLAERFETLSTEMLLTKITA